MPVGDWVLQKASPWQRAVIGRLLAVAERAAPRATLSIKWAQPVFEQSGPFAFIKVARAHVTFGFWRGAELKDPKGLLEGGDVMKHIKIRSLDGMDEPALSEFVRQAIALNESKGDPTKR